MFGCMYISFVSMFTYYSVIVRFGKLIFHFKGTLSFIVVVPLTPNQNMMRNTGSINIEEILKFL